MGFLIVITSLFVMYFLSLYMAIVLLAMGFMLSIIGVAIPDDDGKDKATRAKNIRKIQNEKRRLGIIK